MPTPPKTIAVIIPVRNDDEALARLLALLAADDSELITQVIIASANDQQSTRNIAHAHGAVVVHSSPGRGTQMNAGARHATADVLWFLHADATPSAGSVAAILAHVGAGHVGGYFRFSFHGVTSSAARRLAALINWRAARGIAYGDQGLFFTREFFTEAGGFEDAPLFEEVALVKRARATGQFSALPIEIGVDPRRWQRTGWIRRTLINRALALGHAAGISPHRLAAWYRRF